MKKIFGYLVAGLLGGMVVLGGFLYLKPQHIPQKTDGVALGRLVSNTSSSGMLPDDFRLAAKNSMASVVHIKSVATPKVPSESFNPFGMFGNPFMDFGPRMGTGSGVIYTKDGFIITNNHVVNFADEVEVTLYDNRKYRATVIGKDDKTDLAVLKIEADDLPAIKIGNSDDTQVGDWVLAVGNPFDLTSTVTAGIVSAKGRNLNMHHDNNSIESFIQTDAAVNPGNSGGALVNTRGELIGINTAIASMTGSYAGYSFAIPVNIVTRVADNLIRYGSPKRAVLGVEVSDMDADLAKELKTGQTQGAYIDKVVPGGAAELAGLLPDDIVIKADDIPIDKAADLIAVIGEANVGDKIKLTVLRRDKKIQVDVVLKE